MKIIFDTIYSPKRGQDLLEKLAKDNPNVTFENVEFTIKGSTINKNSILATTTNLILISNKWINYKKIVQARLFNGLKTLVFFGDCFDCLNGFYSVQTWEDIKCFDDGFKQYIVEQENLILEKETSRFIQENKMVQDKLEQYNNNFQEFLIHIEYELESLHEDEETEIDIDINSQPISYLKMHGYKHLSKPTVYMDENDFTFHPEERIGNKYQVTALDIMQAWLQIQWYKLADIAPMKKETYLQDQAVLSW